MPLGCFLASHCMSPMQQVPHGVDRIGVIFELVSFGEKPFSRTWRIRGAKAQPLLLYDSCDSTSRACSLKTSSNPRLPFPPRLQTEPQALPLGSPKGPCPKPRRSCQAPQALYVFSRQLASHTRFGPGKEPATCPVQEALAAAGRMGCPGPEGLWQSLAAK